MDWLPARSATALQAGRDLPPRIRFFLNYVLVFALRFFLFLFTVPLERPIKSGRWLRLVARLCAQQFPDKTAQLPRNGYQRFVAQEPARA